MNAYQKCSTCEHATFDETWGEIICKELFIRIYAPRITCITCKHYKKREINKKDEN